MGKLIVFEGADCVGKGTLSRELTNTLLNEGRQVVRVEPTKESHLRGRKMIYGMLESGAAKRHPNTFQFVQFLNRIYFQLFKLPKLLRDNDIVILDRWALSGYVYGKCEGINSWLNEAMYFSATKADVVVVLTGKSYRRVAADDSYEKDTQLQERVKVEYLSAACTRPGHMIVENYDSIPEIQAEVRYRLKDIGIIT